MKKIKKKTIKKTISLIRFKEKENKKLIAQITNHHNLKKDKNLIYSY